MNCRAIITGVGSLLTILALTLACQRLAPPPTANPPAQESPFVPGTTIVAPPVTMTAVPRATEPPVTLPSATTEPSRSTISPSPTENNLRPSPAPVPATVAVVRRGLPTAGPRDLLDLQRRLRPTPATAISTIPATPPDAPVGTEQLFWIADQTSKTYFQSKFRLALVSDHVYWFVLDGTELPSADLLTASTFFESTTYPTEHRYFGSEPNPGIDGDRHLTVLIGKIPGVSGYYSSADEAPTAVNPFSNQREMIYINVDSVRPGSTGFNNTVAHEFMHMIQFNIHQNQDSWVNEGSAELAAQSVTGSTSGNVRAFESRPETQLNAWAPLPSLAASHYGGAYLFMRYISERFGGFAAVGRAVASPGKSIEAIDEFLRTASPDRSFDDFFADWVAANALSDPTLDDGRYGYKALTLHPTVRPGPNLGTPVSGVVTQFGTTYYRIGTTAPTRLTFEGDRSTQFIGGDPKDTAFEWWSNSGDSIDTRLTRSVDLEAVKSATFQFWAWYDIEGGYDYAYVEASVDAGKTWTTLPARGTTKDNPNGDNYGFGFTGTSGGKTASWTPETIDLSPYAGKKILIRFEYITDDAYNSDGFAIDGVEIPEIGFHDDAGSDDGWIAEGFVRTDNRVAQSYLVEILNPGGSPHVVRMVIGDDAKGKVDLPSGASVTVAVAGLTRSTTHGAAYNLGLAER